MDRGDGEVATCIAIGQYQDFRSSTIGGSTGDRTGKIATGTPREKES